MLMTLILAAAMATQDAKLPGAPSRDYVIEPEQFASVPGSPACPKILDVRKREQFEKEHIRGAVWVDLELWKKRSLTSEESLENVALWQKRAGDLGLAATDEVVIYDDGKLVEAARTWFILQWVGLEKGQVLNGGYPAIAPLLKPDQKAGGGPTPPTPVEFKVEGRLPKAGLVQKKQVRGAIDTGGEQILDARTGDEFSGAAQQKNPRGGHMPSAVNLPHEKLLGSNGRLLQTPELQKLLAESGLKPGYPIVTHCQSGGRAALAALAVLQAGYGPVSNYYMSFQEWSADESCPLEEGPASGPAPGAASQPAKP